jgi:hypothetical protein
MKKLILSLSEVPRTGRTTFSEVLHGLLVQRMNAHGMAHTDAERPLGLSASIFLESSSRLTIEDFIVLLDQAPIAILDVATGETDAILDVYERRELAEVLGEMDTTLTVALPVTANRQTELTVLRVAETFRDDADYVLLRRAGDFGQWSLPNAGRAMHHLGAIEVAVPGLSGMIVEFLDENDATLPQLMMRIDSLSRALQPALRRWQVDYFAALEVASDFLWPVECQAAPAAAPVRIDRTRRTGRRVVPFRSKTRRA